MLGEKQKPLSKIALPFLLVQRDLSGRLLLVNVEMAGHEMVSVALKKLGNLG